MQPHASILGPNLPAPPGLTLLPIRTARLTLRPPAASDRAAIASAYAESLSFLAPWWPHGPEGETPEGWADRQIARAGDDHAAGRGCRLFAFGLGELPLGAFNLNNIARGPFQNADAGWSLFAHATGRGLATEALRALLTLAFLPLPQAGCACDGTRSGLGLHRVQANIMPRNTPSLRLARRVGFREEGLALRMLKISGAWEDHLCHAITSEEWPISG
jgi:ribosomal-protein-alanine N-acetyltransferase